MVDFSQAPVISPPVVSLGPLRENKSSDLIRRTIEQLAASSKKLGCFCIPISDVDSAAQVRAHIAEEICTLPCIRQHCTSPAVRGLR